MVAVEGEAMRVGVGVLLEEAISAREFALNCLPFVPMTLIRDALTAEQRGRIAANTVDAVVAAEGEDARARTWVVVEETVREGEWSIGGNPLTIAAMAAIKRGENPGPEPANPMETGMKNQTSLRLAVGLSGLALAISLPAAPVIAKEGRKMNATTAVAAPQTLTATLDGQRVSYLKAGHGPAMVIIHGLGGHKEDFTKVVELLSDRYTVYAPDLLGFGSSSRTAPSVGPGAQAAMIKALLDHEGLSSAYIAGNSAGGWDAATFAQNYPGAVKKLALIDPAGVAVWRAGA